MPGPEARVPVSDPGFLHGDGCFETIRVHRGAAFRFEAHLSRLVDGLTTLGIEPPEALRAVPSACREVVERTATAEGLIRVTASAKTVVVTARALPEIPARIVLRVVREVVRVPGPMSGCKTISRAAESLALRKAHAAGSFDAILLNPEGRVAETTSRNVFTVSDEVMSTPPISEGALPGVTRAAAIELAESMDLEVAEEPIALPDLAAAEEVFLTGSGVGVVGVARIEDRPFATVPGPVTRRIADGYAALLDAESRW